jgi:hypothetical protein
MEKVEYIIVSISFATLNLSFIYCIDITKSQTSVFIRAFGTQLSVLCCVLNERDWNVLTCVLL